MLSVLEAVRGKTLGETVPELLGVVGTGLGHPLKVENQPEIEKILTFLHKSVFWQRQYILLCFRLKRKKDWK